MPNDQTLANLTEDEYNQIASDYHERHKDRDLSPEQYRAGLLRELNSKRYGQSDVSQRAGHLRGQLERGERWSEADREFYGDPANQPAQAAAGVGALLSLHPATQPFVPIGAGMASGLVSRQQALNQGRSEVEAKDAALASGSKDAALSAVGWPTAGGVRLGRQAVGGGTSALGRHVADREVIRGAQQGAKTARAAGEAFPAAEDVLRYVNEQGFRQPTQAASRVAETQRLLKELEKVKGATVKGAGGRFESKAGRVAGHQREQELARGAQTAMDRSTQSVARQALADRPQQDTSLLRLLNPKHHLDTLLNMIRMEGGHKLQDIGGMIQPGIADQQTKAMQRELVANLLRSFGIEE